MNIEKYKICGETYEVYEVNYKGNFYKIGEHRLGELIMKIIEEDEKYVETEVTTESGDVISLPTLDDEIVCFLGDTDAYGRPTDENIIDSVMEILDDIIND